MVIFAIFIFAYLLGLSVGYLLCKYQTGNAISRFAKGVEKYNGD